MMIDPRLLQMLLMGGMPGGGAGAPFLDAAKQGAPPLMPRGLEMGKRLGPSSQPEPGFMKNLMGGPAPIMAALNLGISGLTGQLEDDPGSAIGGALGGGLGSMGGKAGGAALGAKLGLPFGGPVGAAIGGVVGGLGGGALGKALGGESKSEKKRKEIREEIEQKRALQMMLRNMSATAQYLNRSNQRRARRF